ncbi:MAG TPA: MFS transporter [Thermomicrobiales bacterium]
MPEGLRNFRHLRRMVQTEAGAWGVLSAINNSFINPLLISRGAGAIALGIYNSGANVFGFGSGWVGPRLAARIGSVSRTTLLCLSVARLLFLCIPLTLIAFGSDKVAILVVLVLAWAAGEGLALPLWTSFLTGMVPTEERGRWLAMRATAATGASAVVMLGLAVLLRFSSKESALPFAYGLAACGGFLSLWQLRLLFATTEAPPVPTPRSARSLPPDPEVRRFLKGVACFWFGATLVGPVLTPYIIKDLHAPTAYFALTAVLSSIAAVVVQRRWGHVGDEKGAKRMLLLGGLGAGLVPALWALVPVYWLGFAVDAFASSCWPGHTMGLTMRSAELAEHDADRPNLLAWTSLAQGTGALFAPLIASVLVGFVGTIPLLVASSVIRIGATLYMAPPPRSSFGRRRQASPAPAISPSGQE